MPFAKLFGKKAETAAPSPQPSADRIARVMAPSRTAGSSTPSARQRSAPMPPATMAAEPIEQSPAATAEPAPRSVAALAPPPAAAAPADKAGFSPLAFILLADTAMPSTRGIIAEIAESFPEADVLTGDEAHDQSNLLVGGDWSCHLTFIDAPYPLAEAMPLAQLAWGWPGAKEAVQSHRGHIVVSSMHPEPLKSHLMLTHLVAALLRRTNALGVIWSQTEKLTRTEEFLRATEESVARGEVPALLWANVALESGTNDKGENVALVRSVGAAGYVGLEYEAIVGEDELWSHGVPMMFGVVCRAIVDQRAHPDGLIIDSGERKRGQPVATRYCHDISCRGDGAAVVRLETVALGDDGRPI
jgi:hypothetical protein